MINRTTIVNEIERGNQHKNVDDNDDAFLRELGYTQELHRGLSAFMSFAIGFNVVSVLLSISIGFDEIMAIGGSGVAAWSWIIGSFFTILTGLSLAEMCSVYPTAGSVYHWSGKFVSVRHAPLASFICGWFNFLANVAGDTTFVVGFVQILDSTLVLNGHNSLNTGGRFGIAIAVTLLWTCHNVFRSDFQGWFNNMNAFLQILSIIIISGVLFIFTPELASPKEVFQSTYNQTGLPLTYIYFIGILSTLYSSCGYDSSAHLAEETKNAHRAAPLGIVATCVCGAIFGYLFLLSLLFAMPNVPQFMEETNDSNKTMFLIVHIFKNSVSHKSAMALTILLLLNMYASGISSITVTSRLAFAMARDDVFPFSKYFRWIYWRTKAPVGALILVFFIVTALLLFELVSKAAFEALLTVTTVGYNISFLMPILFRCTSYRRRFPKPKFNLGRFSLPIAIISSIWLVITTILMFFPTHYPVTHSNMNYSIVVISIFALIATIYWLLSARHHFIGPNRPELDPTTLPPRGSSHSDSLAMSIIPTT